MEVVIVVFVLGAIAVMIFKKPISVVYYIVMADILFKILSFIANNLKVVEVEKFLKSLFPSSVNEVINMYSTGIFQTVLLWILMIVYSIFLYKLVKIFLNKK